ncbi:hypothetical protein TNCV_3405191 [Trichonephila clavipes]|nr:hypothetical protein TNCV_3405191 [Trichonephila clavipes]
MGKTEARGANHITFNPQLRITDKPLNYSRTFGDEPCNFELCSSDEINTSAVTPLIATTSHQRDDVSALARVNVHRYPIHSVLSGTRLEQMTRYLHESLTLSTVLLLK